MLCHIRTCAQGFCLEQSAGPSLPQQQHSEVLKACHRVQLAQLSSQAPKRLAQQMQRYGARSQLSFGQQQDGDESESEPLCQP